MHAFSHINLCWMNLMIRGDYLNKTPIHLDNMLYYILVYIMSYTHRKGASLLSTTDYYAISWFTPKLMLMKNCTSDNLYITFSINVASSEMNTACYLQIVHTSISGTSAYKLSNMALISIIILVLFF
jgi:hypothetical protein